MQELGAHPLLIAILYFCITLYISPCLFKGNPLCLKQCPALCNTRRLPIPHILCAFPNYFFFFWENYRREKQREKKKENKKKKKKKIFLLSPLNGFFPFFWFNKKKKIISEGTYNMGDG